MGCEVLLKITASFCRKAYCLATRYGQDQICLVRLHRFRTGIKNFQSSTLKWELARGALDRPNLSPRDSGMPTTTSYLGRIP